MLDAQCKLCLQTKGLQDSHYIPKSAYKSNRAPKLKNPNPVVLSSGKAKQDSTQLTDYVLCSDCEQRFSTKGEAWVLANIPRDYDKPFPIYDALNREVPILVDGGIRLYAGARVKGLDMDRIVYFAMSVFWRGAAHEWKPIQGGVPPKVQLCGYEEPIRQFLLGAEPLPDDVALTVLICPQGRVLNAVLVPWEAHRTDCCGYWFYICGLGFMLYFGSNVPMEFRKMCAYHSAEKFLLVSSEFESTVRQVLYQEVMNTDVTKVRNMLQEIARVRSGQSRP